MSDNTENAGSLPRVYSALNMSLAVRKMDVACKVTGNALQSVRATQSTVRNAVKKGERISEAWLTEMLTVTGDSQIQNVEKRLAEMKALSEKMDDAAKRASVEAVFYAYTENVRELDKARKFLEKRIRKCLSKCAENDIRTLDGNIANWKALESAFQDASQLGDLTFDKVSNLRNMGKPIEKLLKYTVFYALLYSIYAETRFMKIIYAPGKPAQKNKASGKTAEEKSQSSRSEMREDILKQPNLAEKWKCAFRYAFEQVGSKIPLSWEEFFEKYIRIPIEVRNKIAHGNWLFAMDEGCNRLAAPATCTARIGTLDFARIKSLFKLYNKFADCLEKLMDWGDPEYAKKVEDIYQFEDFATLIRKAETDTLLTEWRKLPSPISISNLALSGSVVSFVVENPPRKERKDYDAFLTSYDKDGRPLRAEIVPFPPAGQPYQATVGPDGVSFRVSLMARANFALLCLSGFVKRPETDATAPEPEASPAPEAFPASP